MSSMSEWYRSPINATMNTSLPYDRKGRLYERTQAVQESERRPALHAGGPRRRGRAALRIEGETHWTVEIADGAVVMRPAVVPREDAWAYTPEHAAKVERAREDVRAGREVAVGADELRRIADLSDDDMSAEIDRLRVAASCVPVLSRRLRVAVAHNPG